MVLSDLETDIYSRLGEIYDDSRKKHLLVFEL